MPDPDPRLVVRFFKKPSGEEPVKTFLSHLTREEKKAVGTDLRTCQDYWPRGMPLCENMKGGLYMLRSTVPSRIVRVFFTICQGTMVLLHAFFKTTQKTPKNELDIARSRLDDFMRDDTKKT